MECDEKLSFWYPCVALVVWTNFISCLDVFQPSVHQRSRREVSFPFFVSSLSRITPSPSFFSSFPSLLFLFVFFFFLFLFFSISFSLILPPPNFFWLDLRKFPPYFSSLSHGHVSSHGPFIMCHVSPCEPCAMWHVSHRHML